MKVTPLRKVGNVFVAMANLGELPRPDIFTPIKVNAFDIQGEISFPKELYGFNENGMPRSLWLASPLSSKSFKKSVGFENPLLFRCMVNAAKTFILNFEWSSVFGVANVKISYNSVTFTCKSQVTIDEIIKFVRSEPQDAWIFIAKNCKIGNPKSVEYKMVKDAFSFYKLDFKEI